MTGGVVVERRLSPRDLGIGVEDLRRATMTLAEVQAQLDWRHEMAVLRQLMHATGSRFDLRDGTKKGPLASPAEARKTRGLREDSMGPLGDSGEDV